MIRYFIVLVGLASLVLAGFSNGLQYGLRMILLLIYADCTKRSRRLREAL